MILTIIKNTLLWFLALIFLGIPVLLLFIWRILVRFVVLFLHPSWTVMRVRDVMTTADTIYSRPLLNIGLIVEIEGIVDLHQFRDHFSKSLLDPKDPRTGKPVNGNFFANIARFGGICFKRPIDPKTVQLENQIYETKLAEGETLSKFIVKFFYSAHDETQPLWKVAILQPGDGDDAKNTKIFLKLHHSLGDGMSLIYIFDKLTNNTTTPNIVQPFNETFYDKVKLIAGAPCAMLNFAKKISEEKNPFTMSGIDTLMVYKCYTLDLEMVKKVRRKTGANIAPILFTLQGGALRRLLLEEKNGDEDKLPGNIFSGHSLPWPSHPRNKMCNEWTVGVFKVPIKNKNALERLKVSDNDFKEFLDSGFSRVVKRLLCPIMSLLPANLTEKSGNAETQMATSWSTLLAGNDYKLLGKNVNHIFPFVGFTSSRMAVVTMSLSHTGKIDVTMGANMEFIETEAKLAEVTDTMIQEELRNLVALCEDSEAN